MERISANQLIYCVRIRHIFTVTKRKKISRKSPRQALCSTAVSFIYYSCAGGTVCHSWNQPL